jgi:hypothetical protein
MATAPQRIPLSISIAPFPEGFQGDMDATFQQAVQNMEAFIEGNFLTGLILPPNSTLPTTDQGPIAMGEQWYFWDSATSQYLPQTVSVKTAKNFAKNCVYQIAQGGTAFSPPIGITHTFDMVLCRLTQPGVIAISVDVGPGASGDNDPIPAAIAYTVGPALVPSPIAADLFTHEHCFEGSDIAALQGQTLSLSFSVWGNQPGVYSAYLTSAGRDVSYVVPFQILAANQWTRIKVPGIPPLPTNLGTWNFGQGVTGLYFGVPLLVGTQWQTTNPNHWVSQFVAGTSGNINLLTVANNQLKITGIKLEASSSVSYLSSPIFDDDYWDAIRYYFTTFTYQSASAGLPILGRAPVDGQWIFSQLWPHRMARTPVCTPYSYLSPANAGFFSDLSLGIDMPKATMVAMPKGVDDAGSANIAATGTIGSITGLIGTLTANSATITLTTGTTAALTKGMPVTGTNVPAGATIEYVASNTVFVITIPVGATGGTGVALTFGTIHITAIASTTGMAVGQAISGTGIPAGATIAIVVSGTAIDLSVPALPGTAVALTIPQTRKADTLAAFFTADARLS